MFGFLVELRKMMKGQVAKLEAKSCDNKGIGILQVCYGELQLMEYFNIAP